MVLEVIAPILPAVVGALAGAVWGAYRNVGEDGESFEVRKFIMAIPKGVVSGLVALAGLYAAGGAVDPGTAVGFWAIFSAGFIGPSVVKTK